MARPRRIGLVGGTFDPIHLGHTALAVTASRALSLDEVRIVPARVPPHRPQPGASIYHRFAMAAVASLEYPHLVVDDIEARDEERAYTAVTLRRLHASGLAALQIFFIAGADAFAEIATWHDYPHVLNEANFAVVSRGTSLASSLPDLLPALASRMHMVAPSRPAPVREGQQPAIFLIDGEVPPVSSTTIRARAAERQSLDGYVTPLVAEYITRHGLYRKDSSSIRPGGGARELHEQESV
jgi:nicotinate-nucleotide adenylyltransferase